MLSSSTIKMRPDIQKSRKSKVKSQRSKVKGQTASIRMDGYLELRCRARADDAFELESAAVIGSHAHHNREAEAAAMRAGPAAAHEATFDHLNFIRRNAGAAVAYLDHHTRP